MPTYSCILGTFLTDRSEILHFFPGDGLGEGYGMLGQAGSGKLRVSVAQSKLATKAAKRYAISINFHIYIYLYIFSSFVKNKCCCLIVNVWSIVEMSRRGISL